MTRFTRKITYSAAGMLFLSFAAGARAQGTDAIASARATSVPRLVQFNGTLKDASARAVTGVASVTFAIYAEQDGGTPLWSETQNVLADGSGRYNVLLGAATANGVAPELFATGASRWLGITIARMPELPRVLLASVPYALKAGDADTLGGRPASEYITASQLEARGTVAVAPSTTIVSAGGGVVASSGAANAAVTGANDASGASAQSVTQATITGTGTANYLPLWTSGTNLGVSKIYQANGGFVGINTATPLLQLDVNGNSIFRGSFQMAPQGTANASAGQPSHSFQWQGSLYDSSLKAAVNEAFGFRTVPATNNVANPVAKLDLFYGPGGGTLTDTGLSIGSTGLITFAPGQTLGASMLNIASGGTTVSAGGASNAISVSTPDGIGADIVASSESATGIYVSAASEAAIGVHAVGGEYGVLAYSQQNNSTAGYFSAPLSENSEATGIYVEGFNALYAKTYATNGDAGYFVGDVAIVGNVSKSGGSFKIDDPIDPANKYLSHSFVESPDMKNVYDGVVTTDASGAATVTMPEWFEALNRDFRYQLTTIGQPAQAWIATELANRAFTIRTDKPNVKVSWQITGIRQDAWANAHRIPVEEDKAGAEKGRYLTPELFGKSDDASIAELKIRGHRAPAANQAQVTHTQK